MKKLDYAKVLLISFLFISATYSQTYQGPAQGSVPSGVTVSTNSFSKYAPVSTPKERAIKHKESFNEEPIFMSTTSFVPNPEDVYFEDKSVAGLELNDTTKSILLNNFFGIAQTNSIPPDPHIAVGTNHVIATVNSRFAIWDKEGNLLKNIDADSWYSSTLSNVGAFDCKVLFDHFNNRWIMVWLDQSDSPERGYYLLSVSENDNPIGTWYNWALPSTLNGTTTVSNWGDYQGVGFDEEAIYLTSNQFQFNGSFQYSKLRIIPKAQLYANTAGECKWFDIWNISYPPGVTGKPFTLRPSITYDASAPYYILNAPSGGGNFISVYKVENPTTSPTLTGSLIAVPYFYVPPNANQLGGSTTLIDGGTNCTFRFKPIYMDGYIWGVHGIRNPENAAYSSLKYYKINTSNNTIKEQAAFGAIGHWLYYPALAVDSAHNIAISFSRSGDNEYAGAFYVSKRGVDSAGFDRAFTLQEGKGNYVKTFSGTRNRWGDYNGIWLDPINKKDFWLIGEYAHATNTWGTWVGQLRVALEAGPSALTITPELDFEPAEVNTFGEVKEVVIKNFGSENLVINDIQIGSGQFRILDLTYPLTLIPYESTSFHVLFEPNSVGIFTDTLNVTSNDPNFPAIVLNARGYEINEVEENKIYASSGIGNTYEVNIVAPSATLLGEANYSEIRSFAIDPNSKIMYGVVTGDNKGTLVRVNATGGDAYRLFDLDVPYAYSIAFDTTGVLYLASRTGTIYTIDLEDQSVDSVVKAQMALASIAFEPETNEMWASVYRPLGTMKDRIIKVNLVTGDTTVIGTTGFGIVVNDIEFSKDGTLFGVQGSAVQPSDLIKIDKETAIGTLIGSLGVNNITSLAFSPVITSVKEIKTGIPSQFSLSQNYPNPFNPNTQIEYSLPVNANVRLVVYNILGEAVKTLVNTYQPAGVYTVNWNSDDNSGRRLTSGIYFYEMKANTSNGQEFNQLRKMILLK